MFAIFRDPGLCNRTKSPTLKVTRQRFSAAAKVSWDSSDKPSRVCGAQPPKPCEHLRRGRAALSFRSSGHWLALANLFAPVIHVGVPLQVAVNFLLVIEVIGQRGVKLRLREVWKALQNLVRRHAELVVTGDGAHHNARAFDDGHAVQDSRIGRDVRIFDSVCFHGIRLSQPRCEASLCWPRKFAAFSRTQPG